MQTSLPPHLVPFATAQSIPHTSHPRDREKAKTIEFGFTHTSLSLSLRRLDDPIPWERGGAPKPNHNQKPCTSLNSPRIDGQDRREPGHGFPKKRPRDGPSRLGVEKEIMGLHHDWIMVDIASASGRRSGQRRPFLGADLPSFGWTPPSPLAPACPRIYLPIHTQVRK